MEFDAAKRNNPSDYFIDPTTLPDPIAALFCDISYKCLIPWQHCLIITNYQHQVLNSFIVFFCRIDPSIYLIQFKEKYFYCSAGLFIRVAYFSPMQLRVAKSIF